MRSRRRATATRALPRWAGRGLHLLVGPLDCSRTVQNDAYRDMLCCMRTTVDLPDELLTQARSRAAEEGSTLTALLADGLRLRLERERTPSGTPRQLPVSRNYGGMQPWIDPASNASLLDAADDGAAA